MRCLSDLNCLIWSSPTAAMFLQMTQLDSYLCIRTILQCIYTTFSSPIPLLSSNLVPQHSNCEQCCNRHWCESSCMLCWFSILEVNARDTLFLQMTLSFWLAATFSVLGIELRGLRVRALNQWPNVHGGSYSFILTCPYICTNLYDISSFVCRCVWVGWSWGRCEFRCVSTTVHV